MLVVLTALYALQVQRPRVVCCPGGRAAAIVAKVHRLHALYWPCPLAPGTLGVLLYLIKENFHRIPWLGQRLFPLPTYEREQLSMQDGGMVGLDWMRRPHGSLNDGSRRPVFVVLPGVTSKSDDLASRNFALAATERGWRSCVVLRRGHDLPLSTPQINLFGSAADVHEIVLHIAKICPGAPIALLGISGGSATAIRYARECHLAGRHEHLVCCIGVSPGYDISI
eukprot:COSAG01_NODE_15880_length_1289_cov_1.017647_1_plen_224_part_01